MHQRSLFAMGEPALATDPTVERIRLDDHAWIDLARGFLLGADPVLDTLIEAVNWRQGRRRMWDNVVDEPRLTRTIRRGEPLPHPVFEAVRHSLERRYRHRLYGPGINYYRDGRDSVAPHNDSELRDLDDTLVAIVTFGSVRPFLIKPRCGGPSIDLAPGSGDLLVMGGTCQRDFDHGVPKVARVGPRISATWRWSMRPTSWSPANRSSQAVDLLH